MVQKKNVKKGIIQILLLNQLIEISVIYSARAVAIEILGVTTPRREFCVWRVYIKSLFVLSILRWSSGLISTRSVD